MLPRVDKLVAFLVVLALVVPACVKAFASSSSPAAYEKVLLGTSDAFKDTEQKEANLPPKQEPSTTPCLAVCSDWKATNAKLNSIKSAKSVKAILPGRLAVPKLTAEKITPRASPPLITPRPHRYATMFAKSGRLLI